MSTREEQHNKCFYRCLSRAMGHSEDLSLIKFGERNPHIRPKAAKAFVRQPRGGRVELSRHAVQDIHQHFPLAVGRHGYPSDVPVTTDRHT
jgi:hypothetical protein